MHNTWITKLCDWQPKLTKRGMRHADRFVRRLWPGARLQDVYGTGAMTSVEQRMNLWHLLSACIAYGVPGEIVELGVSDGQTATLFAKLGGTRRLRLYDYFGRPGQVDTVRANLASVDGGDVALHPGSLYDTVPRDLPERIAFAHIDVGSPDAGAIAKLVRHCVEAIYPRLSPGAVVVIQDYCAPEVLDSWNPWPAVRDGADAALQGKPESVAVLWAGHHSHGFFRRLSV